jgi:hypothetical protein
VHAITDPSKLFYSSTIGDMSSPPESITDNYDFYGELLDQYKYDDWTNWINNTLTLLDNCNLTNNLQLINTNNNIQAENSKETDSHPFNSPVNNDILIQYDMDLINQQHQIKPTSSVPELVDSTPYQSDEEQDELSNGLTVSMCEVSASKDYILNEHLQDHTHIMSHYEYHTEDYTSGRQPDNATYETTDISFSELGRYHHTEDHTTTGQTTDAATYEFGRYYHTDTTITTINNDATNDNNNKNIDLLSDNNHDEIEIEEGSFTTVSLNDELTRDNAHSLLPTSILKYSMKNPNKQTLPSESLSGPLSKLSTEIQLERHKMLNEIFYLIQITTKVFFY